MKSTAYGNHVIQLTRFGTVNCYLVREDDGFSLIDTNLPGSAGAILNAAHTHGAPIVRVALTHAHNDHVASLDALRQELPDTEIAITITR
jgi:glyoxylase-like metal-dependent hydrolase (beta-lactamase superfamily II)